MAEGEFTLVRQHLEAALERDVKPASAPTGEHDMFASLADAAAQQLDEVALRKYAPLAEETATHINHTLYTAIAHRAWGVAHRIAGEYVEAEARLSRSLEIFQSLGAQWQNGRTAFELGELARAQGNAALARDHYSRALNAFEEMQAAPDAARTRAALEQIEKEIMPQAYTRPPKYPAGLTEREVEVLRWLAQGLSNQDIADKLVLSRRTVHSHLRSIFGKLDVTTRTAATRAAIENKIV